MDKRDQDALSLIGIGTGFDGVVDIVPNQPLLAGILGDLGPTPPLHHLTNDLQFGGQYNGLGQAPMPIPALDFQIVEDAPDERVTPGELGSACLIMGERLSDDLVSVVAGKWIKPR